MLELVRRNPGCWSLVCREEKGVQNGVNSLTSLPGLPLHSRQTGGCQGPVTNCVNSLRAPVILKKTGLNSKLVSALIFNSRTDVSTTTRVDKQGFKIKPCLRQPDPSLPPGLTALPTAAPLGPAHASLVESRQSRDARQAHCGTQPSSKVKSYKHTTEISYITTPNLPLPVYYYLCS